MSLAAAQLKPCTSAHTPALLQHCTPAPLLPCSVKNPHIDFVWTVDQLWPQSESEGPNQECLLRSVIPLSRGLSGWVWIISPAT